MSEIESLRQEMRARFDGIVVERIQDRQDETAKVLKELSDHLGAVAPA